MAPRASRTRKPATGASRRRKPGGPSRPGGQGERLQKVLAAAGAGSRRKCEELILAGRVEVDRRVVTKLGTRVDPGAQQIRLDGEVLSQPKLVYYALNKPSGVICTNRDPSGRARAVDLVPAGAGRLFTVGRLDLYSEGLILVTNDGQLANQLAHPRYGVRKTYRVLVAGHPTREVLDGLRRGVRLAEGLARPVHVRPKKRHKDSTILEMVLDEGRNREIRRVLARVGHKVLRLARIAVGPVRLGNLPSGTYRPLTRREVQSLRGVGKKGEDR